MKAIWKYRLEVTDIQILKIPAGARPLSVAMHYEKLCVWMLVDPSEQVVINRVFSIVGTGHPAYCADETFVGTVLDGPLVWHVFCEKEKT